MAALNFTAAPRYRPQRSHAEELERARSALQSIDPGCDRDTWVKAAMGAKAAGLDEADFIAWSECAANFDSERDCRSVWRSIGTDGGIKAGTLFALARDAGWSDARHEAWAHRPMRTDAPSKPQKAAGGPRFDVAGVWASCEPATPEHAYIARKRGLPDGLRVVPADSGLRVAGQSVAGWLAVPMFDATPDEPASLQFIAPDKGKLTAPGPMAGWFTVGGAPCVGSVAYVCEGIGAAWSAHQATRSPAVVAFGAGRMAEIARTLTERIPGVRVVLVGDVGKEAKCEEVARALGCEWVAPPADLGSNGDVNDLHARDGLQAVADLLTRTHKPERRFRVLTAEQLAEMPPVRWRVRGVLPAQGLAAIFGPPGSGKSFLALDLLGAVAEGRDWFEHRTIAAPVTYLALEGEAGIAQRLAAYRMRYGRAPAGMRFVAQPFALLEAGDIAELAEAIRAAGGASGIVAIDTLNRASPGADENDSRDMGDIIAGAKALQAALGGLVLLVHHSGKDATRGLRGHSSLLAALDAAVEVRRDDDRREWRTTKAKDASDGAAFPFGLDVVELGVDDFGEPVTSCVVAPAQPAAESVKRSTVPGGGNMRAAWDRIGELLRSAGDVRPEGAPAELPPGRPTIQMERAIEETGRLLVVEEKRRRERATQAISGLCNRGLMRCVDGWLWCV